MLTILVIDDSLTNLLLVNSIIEELEEDYEVVLESESREVMEKIALILPDIVILDIMMPDVDGMHILHGMKNDPRLKNIPVIILSALHEVEAEQRALDAGAACYLRKPLIPQDLTSKIRSVARDREIRKSPDDCLRRRRDELNT